MGRDENVIIFRNTEKMDDKTRQIMLVQMRAVAKI